jgi:tetratricopeptide (TPR) repeat protein
LPGFRGLPSLPKSLSRALRLGLALLLLAGIGLSILVARSDWAYRRAYRVLAAGDLAASERWLALALAGVPDEARVWIARGEVARHRARLASEAAARSTAMAAAVEHFARAAAIEPQIAARWQRLAIVMQEALALDPSIGAPSSGTAEAFANRLAAAVDRAQEANPSDPLNARLLAELAAQGRAGAAAPRQSESISLLQMIAAGEGWAAGTAARHLGDQALAEDRTAEARSWYDRALLAGENPELELALGHLARAEGQLAVADRHYRRALAARPDAREAYAGLRDVAAARGDSGEARRWEIEVQRLAREDR